MPLTTAWLDGLTAAMHITDSPACTAARASIRTGKTQRQHRETQDDRATYYRYDVQGNTIGGGFGMCGPHERDSGDTTRSGGIFNAMRQNGFKTFMAGKLTHGYGFCTTVQSINYGLKNYAGDPLGGSDFPIAVKRIPPDIECAHLRCGPGSAHAGATANWNGGDPDPYESWWSEKLETDVAPLNTEALITAPVYHYYDHAITSAMISGTTATLLLAAASVAELQTNDLIVVRSVNVAGYNTAHTEVPITVVDSTHVSYTVTGAAPGGPGTGGTMYIQKNFGTTYGVDRFLDWYARRDIGDDWFALLTPNACHNVGTSSPSAQRPNMKYDATVNPADFDTKYATQEAALLINTADTLYTNAKPQWEQRQESVRQMDEQIDRIRVALSANGDDSHVIVIFTGDQGIHHGEHSLWRDPTPLYFPKETAYDPSCSTALIGRNLPGITPGTTITRWTAHVDLLPTILDAVGLTSHPYKTRGEGVSFYDLLSNAWPGRAYFIDHHLPGKPSVNAILDENLIKWITAVPTAVDPDSQIEQMYDLTTNPDELPSGNLLVTDNATWQPLADSYRTARAPLLRDAAGDTFRGA